MRPHRALRGEALTAEAWEEPFERALRTGDVLGASDALRRAGKDGWIRKAQRERAIAIIDAIDPAPFVRRDWADRLIAHPRRVDKELAAAIVAPLARTHPRDVERVIDKLRRERDPAVRRAFDRLVKTLAQARAPQS